ncbi:hypothetical protein [Helicovermis profundi]|uniref:Uncharacterized protein n=1 Tax=Helicovermis profundi TaxID=3065157 RepID=A0AAU9EBZ4_9FIRM|nr:hypothetical protein HLPR_26980 [Clostridia bacterium S502]
MKSRNKVSTNLIISLIIALVITSLYYYTRDVKISTIISLQFDGIEKGLNPDDTRFDYKNIVSEDVLKLVAKEANIKYTKELLSSIEIKEVLPSNIVRTIKSRRIDGDNYTYYPNEFIVSIDTKSKNGLTKEEDLKFLSKFKEGYEKYFIDKYSYPFIGLSNMVSYFDYSKYDYPELTKIFKSEFNMISSYLDVLINDNKDFVSDKGYTFKDIKETINISKDLDMDRIDSLVNRYELTNDVDILILKYKYMISRYELEKNKSISEYSSLDNLISIIKNNEHSVVIPSSLGNSITINKLDDTYDTVASEATGSKLNVGKQEEKIKYLQSEIEKLSKLKSETKETKEAKAEVDKMVKELNQKILNWTDLIDEVSLEYFSDKYSNSIELVEEAWINRAVSTLRVGVLGILIMIMIFSFLRVISYKFKNRM